MFRNRLFPVVRPTAEFVPSRHFNADLVRPEPSPPPVAAKMEDARSPVWSSASSRRIRIVEAAVILSLMAYFGSGLAKAIGLL